MVNDANLAALGEAWFGAGRGRRAVFHICVADGIGAGFVFDGRLFTGAHGFSGELAHVQVTPEGPGASAGTAAASSPRLPSEACGTARSAGDMAELGSLRGPRARPADHLLDPDCVVVDARLAERLRAVHRGSHRGAGAAVPAGSRRDLAVVAGELD